MAGDMRTPLLILANLCQQMCPAGEAKGQKKAGVRSNRTSAKARALVQFDLGLC
jgi:hypothetical protein